MIFYICFTEFLVEIDISVIFGTFLVSKEKKRRQKQFGLVVVFSSKILLIVMAFCI